MAIFFCCYPVVVFRLFSLALKVLCFAKVRSTAAGGTKLIQVESTSSMLNSNDAFLLKDGNKGFIWIGLGASDDEVEAARFGAG